MSNNKTHEWFSAEKSAFYALFYFKNPNQDPSPPHYSAYKEDKRGFDAVVSGFKRRLLHGYYKGKDIQSFLVYINDGSQRNEKEPVYKEVY